MKTLKVVLQEVISGVKAWANDNFSLGAHVHGNITNDGKVGTTANLPLITGTGGTITAGAFGNQANTFCEGNDSRLSDARTPVAHTHGKADITDLFNSANTWSGSNIYASNVNLYNSDNTQNTPTLYLRNSKAIISSSGNTAGYQGIYFNDGNNSTLAFIRGAVQSNGCVINLKTFTKDSNNNTVESGFQVGSFTDGSKWLAPSENGTINLGGINYKWKTLNGVNPGALSLPDNSNYTNISGNITDLTGSVNSYTPPFDGYVMVNVNPNSNNYAYVSLERVTVRSSSETTSGKNAMATISVIGGKSIDISVIGASIAQARFTPCLGNV